MRFGQLPTNGDPEVSQFRERAGAVQSNRLQQMTDNDGRQLDQPAFVAREELSGSGKQAAKVVAH